MKQSIALLVLALILMTGFVLTGSEWRSDVQHGRFYLAEEIE